MPGVYEGRCVGCDEKFVMLDYGNGVYLDDGTVVLLPHPGESHWILQYGFTWYEASSQGRIVVSDTTVCGTCGSLHNLQHLPRRRFPPSLHVPDVPRWMGWGIVAIAAVIYALFNAPALGALTGFALLFGCTAVLEHLARRRERRVWEEDGQRYADVMAERARALKATEACGFCGGRKLTRLLKVNRELKYLRCPRCNLRTLSLHSAGIA